VITCMLVALVGGCSAKNDSGARQSAPKYEWRAHHDAGVAAHARGDNQTAEAEFGAAIAIAGQFKSMDLGSAISENALAVIYIDGGRLSEAAPLINDSIRILEERGQTDDEYFALMLTNRGHLEILLGSPADAERDYRRSLAIGAVPQATQDRARRGVVAALCEQGRTDEAKQIGAPLGIQCAQR
jgi:tetratricopeptide (TPR) repeat protein